MEEDCIIRRKGVLVLLKHPLPSREYDPEILAESNRLLRRSKQKNTPPLSPPIWQDYDPSKSTFTLFFLGDSCNLNAVRFRPKLVRFSQAHTEAVQIICVLNRDGSDSFCNGTGFAFIPLDYPNRTTLLALLAVTCVPSVVVIENKTGRRITDLGMQAIDTNDDSKIILERWSKRQSGLDIIQWTMTNCHIS